MTRDKSKDEAWLREVLQQSGIKDTVYIRQNHYDGGYEVRVGVTDVFVEYEAIDDQELSWIDRLR